MRTGFDDLDELVDINEPQLIVLGARPRMGKTTFSLNMATNIAIHQNVPVLFFSLEETYLSTDMKELNYIELTKNIKDEPFNCLVDKIIAAEEMIPINMFRKVRNPYLYFEEELSMNEEEFNQKLYSGIEKLKKSKLFIKDKAPVTIDEIVFDIEEYAKNENVKFVLIDYLQLIQYDKSKLLSRDNEICNIMKRLKDISEKHKITILVTSQISKKTEDRCDHRPLLTDLRKNEHIVEIADTIILLYRDDYYNYDSEMKNIAELSVLKNKKSSIGIINLVYFNIYFKFESLKKGYCETNNVITPNIKRDRIISKINEICNSDKRAIFIETWFIDYNYIIDMILKILKDKNIKSNVYRCVEDEIINSMMDNNINEYINKFKDSEYVIFTFSYIEMNEKLQDYIYDTSKRILDNGTTKKIIYISETCGLAGFSKHIYKELNQNLYTFKK